MKRVTDDLIAAMDVLDKVDGIAFQGNETYAIIAMAHALISIADSLNEIKVELKEYNDTHG